LAFPPLPPVRGEQHSSGMKLVTALVYGGALACGAIWAGSRPAQTQGETQGERFWRSAEQVSLLERSYVRCVRERYKAAGLPMSAGLEYSMLLHQRDLWGQALPDPDLTAAPLERIGRRSFIQCAWFSNPG
jgi:hypothetical protein